ncbi:hypothetical protein [Mesorhizobium sp.]|uniref:hypothetical protein n=1 Tax=Mesorhizobium sp. TaxID=1871066 RepID=UPI000FE676BB|nr:hypothetical protein [Mesorhizobium sp.]RWM28490.1 MAG: hypothetical protein EOR74_09175 [Mesorhizobium sp.]
MTFPMPVLSPIHTRTPEYGYRTTVTDVSTVSGGVDRTFSGVDIGTANADRQVIVMFSARTATVATVSSVTIGGVAATPVVGIVGNAGAQIAVYRANVPSGTTADVVVRLSASSTDGTIHVYRVVPRTTGTPVDSGSAASNATTTVTATDIAVTNGGFLIVGAIDGLNPASLTPVYNGADSPTNNYGAIVNQRTRLAWSAAITETVGTNDPGASKPATNGFNLNVVAASWD